MLQIELHNHNLEAVLADLATAEQTATDELADAADDVLLGAARVLEAYPPERPGQRYRRTEDLKRGWQQARPARSGTTTRLSNPVAHGPYVQGDEDQADVHAGRWPTVGSVQEDQDDTAQARLEQAADRLGARIGGGS